MNGVNNPVNGGAPSSTGSGGGLSAMASPSPGLSPAPSTPLSIPSSAASSSRSSKPSSRGSGGGSSATTTQTPPASAAATSSSSSSSNHSPNHSANGQNTRRMVGQYEVLRKIGSGSFANVWKGQHVKSKMNVAIKSINREKLSLNKKHSENLESEINILKRFSHGNIVKLFEIHSTERHIYLVMEYCSGGDMARFIRKNGPLKESVARNFLLQLVSGLKFMHENHLIHRDLKPQNLLLDSESLDAKIKIADFGFARYVQPQSMVATLCGSPLYMAPEILRYHKYDASVDLWSLGTIFYEMLFRQPPFTGANHIQLLQRIEQNDVKFPPNHTISPEAIQLLEALLKRNPTERITFEAFFAHPYLKDRNDSNNTIDKKADTNSNPAPSVSSTAISTVTIDNKDKHSPNQHLAVGVVDRRPESARSPTTNENEDEEENQREAKDHAANVSDGNSPDQRALSKATEPAVALNDAASDRDSPAALHEKLMKINSPRASNGVSNSPSIVARVPSKTETVVSTPGNGLIQNSPRTLPLNPDATATPSSALRGTGIGQQSMHTPPSEAVTAPATPPQLQQSSPSQPAFSPADMKRSNPSPPVAMPSSGSSSIEREYVLIDRDANAQSPFHAVDQQQQYQQQLQPPHTQQLNANAAVPLTHHSSQFEQRTEIHPPLVFPEDLHGMTSDQIVGMQQQQQQQQLAAEIFVLPGVPLSFLQQCTDEEYVGCVELVAKYIYILVKCAEFHQNREEDHTSQKRLDESGSPPSSNSTVTNTVGTVSHINNSFAACVLYLKAVQFVHHSVDVLNSFRVRPPQSTLASQSHSPQHIHAKVESLHQWLMAQLHQITEKIVTCRRNIEVDLFGLTTQRSFTAVNTHANATPNDEQENLAALSMFVSPAATVAVAVAATSSSIAPSTPESLSSFSAEKLLYDWALHLCRSGAVDEMMSHHNIAAKKYGRAMRTFELLLKCAKQYSLAAHHDQSVLQRLMNLLQQRLDSLSNNQSLSQAPQDNSLNAQQPFSGHNTLQHQHSHSNGQTYAHAANSKLLDANQMNGASAAAINFQGAVLAGRIAAAGLVEGWTETHSRIGSDFRGSPHQFSQTSPHSLYRPASFSSTPPMRGADTATMSSGMNTAMPLPNDALPLQLPAHAFAQEQFFIPHTPMASHTPPNHALAYTPHAPAFPLQTQNRVWM